MTGYATIKALARDERCSPEDLLAMARKNDPFYSGSGAQTAMAEWFKDWWHRLGFQSGVHLRRMHYQLVSQEHATRHDGRPYQNTLESWGYLCDAGKHARYLGMVAASAFVDRRNPDPHVNGNSAWYSHEPTATVDEPRWSLPEIQTNLEWSLSMPSPTTVDGYSYDDISQPYTLELWIEKSTMDDVLIPLCRQHGVTLQTALGFQSITGVLGMLVRARDAGRPVRVLYISDFDPAGDLMPTAIARQIEYWREQYCPDLEIKLQPIALTAAQVIEYGLPPIPVKESDLRKQAFLDRRGVEGATELDALEALRPGVLRRIVEDAIRPYRDSLLSRTLERAERQAQRIARNFWAEAVEPVSDDLSRLEAQAQAVIDGYAERLQELRDAMETDMAPLRREMERLRGEINDARAGYEVELPERPTADCAAVRGEADEDGWLFDSGRDYMEQLGAYRARKAGVNGHEED